ADQEARATKELVFLLRNDGDRQFLVRQVGTRQLDTVRGVFLIQVSGDAACVGSVCGLDRFKGGLTGLGYVWPDLVIISCHEMQSLRDSGVRRDDTVQHEPVCASANSSF